MTKSSHNRRETSRFFRLNRSNHSPKSLGVPSMRVPNHSNPMLVGGSVAAKPS